MMDKNALWKWLVFILLVAWSVGLVAVSGIRLGLDLQGGTSFTVEIDRDRVRDDIRARKPAIREDELAAEVKSVMEGSSERALEVLRNRVDTMGIDEPVIYPGKDGRIVIQLPGVNEETRRMAESNILSVAYLEFRLVHKDNAKLVEKVFADRRAPEGYIPVADKMVYRRDESFTNALDRAYYRRLAGFQLPDNDYEFMLEKFIDDRDKRIYYRPNFVKRRAEMSGDLLSNAQVGYGPMGQPVVDLTFDGKGKRLFGQITEKYCPNGTMNGGNSTGRQLAIVLDGTLYSAPYIRQAIYAGRAEITGNFSRPEAQLLANVLKAGSLPAPVKIAEKSSVDPSLGRDSIRSGVRAAILGSLAVIVFMTLYYRMAGLVANAALILDLVLLPFGMWVTAGFLGLFAGESGGGSMMRLQLPVLTLPGIAGIALTIGMAVDANVLIFERIREESRAGKRLWTAILAGYDRAFLAIFDSNITTLITGVILFVFGSGPVRGYGVTLCAGIIVSMYTALSVTKLIFGLVAPRSTATNLNMMEAIKTSAIDFIRYRKIAAAVSLGVIVVTGGIMAARGVARPDRIFDIDFVGGTSLLLKFAQPQDQDAVTKALREAGLPDARVQYRGDLTQVGVNRLLDIKVGVAEVGGRKVEAVVLEALRARFPQSGFEASQVDEVGPQVGSELKKRALNAVLLSLLAIIIYLAFRFEFGFSLGAVAAVFHDVLVTVGIFSLCGRQLGLGTVAALLTIIGYSVNDTIVIFDRIRENLKLVHNKTFVEICNLSLNQTLSRTILTNTLTMLSVLALLVFGGGAINDFALAMFIGMIAGTYSTVYIATPVVLAWHRGKRPELATAKTKAL